MNKIKIMGILLAILILQTGCKHQQMYWQIVLQGNNLSFHIAESKYFKSAAEAKDLGYTDITILVSDYNRQPALVLSPEAVSSLNIAFNDAVLLVCDDGQVIGLSEEFRNKYSKGLFLKDFWQTEQQSGAEGKYLTIPFEKDLSQVNVTKIICLSKVYYEESIDITTGADGTLWTHTIPAHIGYDAKVLAVQGTKLAEKTVIILAKDNSRLVELTDYFMKGMKKRKNSSRAKYQKVLTEKIMREAYPSIFSKVLDDIVPWVGCGCYLSAFFIFDHRKTFGE